jgi:serine/threonine protein kinase
MLLYFCCEVAILAQCHNYFLLPFFGFSVTAPYIIVTEFIPCGSLFDSLRRAPGAPRLDAGQKLLVALGTARGMMALHERSIVHRDLKSLNILLDDDLLPKVCDFGIARFMGDADVEVTGRIGTPHWMAPEMFESDHYTNKVDVYAYGILLWEILTGAVPFKGRDAYKVAIAVTRNHERPPLPTGIPRGIIELIKACWDPAPENRPTFAQITLKLTQKLVSFPGGTADAVDAFLARFPFSAAELATLTRPDGNWSAALDQKMPAPQGFDTAAFAVRPGERSPVETKPAPLGPDRPRHTEDDDQAADQPVQAGDPDGPTSDDPEGKRQSTLQAGSGARQNPLAPAFAEPPQNVAGPSFAQPPQSIAGPNFARPPQSVAGPVFMPPPQSVAGPNFARQQSLPQVTPRAGAWQPMARAGCDRKGSLNFEQIFNDKPEAVQSDGMAPDFFTDLEEQFAQGLHVTFQTHIFTQLSIFMYHTPAVVPTFVGSGLLKYIDWTNEELFSVHLRLLLGCIAHQIACLTVVIITSLSVFSLSRNNAQRLLKLWYVFVTKSSDHPDAEAILQVLIEGANSFLFSDKYISILFNIYSQYPNLRASLLPIFQVGIVSIVSAVARACYRVFAQIEVPLRDVPFQAIIAGIADGSFSREGVAVLAQVQFLPTSNRLAGAVLSAAQISPLALFVLCRLAMVPKGAEILAQNPAWLTPGLFSACDAVLLLLSVGQHPGVRNGLPAVPGFSAFLAWLAGEATPKDLEAVIPFLRRTAVTPYLIIDMDKAGFFRNFFARTIQHSDLLVQDSAIMLIDKFSRVGWADGYVDFIKGLPVLFDIQPLQQKALVAALVLAAHAQAKQWLVGANLAPALRGMAIDPAYEQYRQNLLQFITG